MVARLVSVSILSDESGDVRRSLGTFDHRRNDEERIELAEELFLASEAAYESSEIVRHKPCVLPSVALAIVICTVCGSERAVFSAEPAFAILSSDEAELMVEELYV